MPKILWVSKGQKSKMALITFLAFFSVNANEEITRDDQVICVTEFSKVLPIEDGEIYVSLTKGRPSANDIWSSDSLQEWVLATNIRLRLIQTKTMLGHLMSVAQGDRTVTRRVCSLVFTAWKFDNFSVTQISREIILAKLKSQNSI